MRINLLPPEILERQRYRRRTVLVGVAGAFVILVLIGVYLLQAQRLAGVQDDLDAQLAINAQLQQEIGDLQEFAELEAELAANRELLAQLLVNEVRWSGVLRDISLVIPGEAWLTGLNGTVVTPGAEEVPTEELETGLIGQIALDGFAFDHRVVALWLSRLEEIEGLVNPWLSTSERTQIGETDVVQFNSSVDISEAAAVVRDGGPV